MREEFDEEGRAVVPAQRAEEEGGIIYVEGVQNLRPGIERLVSSIYTSDAARILDSVLSLAAVKRRSLLLALEALAEPESHA